MHDARNGQIDRPSSPGDAKAVGTRRRSRLPEAALGAAIIGLMLTPPQATAGTSITATSDQHIEYALAAATTARTAYDTYFAAANEGCVPATGKAGSCDVAFTGPQSAGDGGREAAGPSPAEH